MHQNDRKNVDFFVDLKSFDCYTCVNLPLIRAQPDLLFNFYHKVLSSLSFISYLKEKVVMIEKCVEEARGK